MPSADDETTSNALADAGRREKNDDALV